jgi:hypothetical protein
MNFKFAALGRSRRNPESKTQCILAKGREEDLSGDLAPIHPVELFRSFFKGTVQLWQRE